MDEVELPKHLPYRAEYAKSSRAKCKGCQNEILKAELRLALMVKSGFFDGMQPNWYHYDCFFQKARPKSVGDISHYESLRWEDQKRIKTKIEKSATDPSKALDVKEHFSIEYAKSSRSTCLPCNEVIAKGDVRIGKKDFESGSAHRFGPMFRWHHVDCFVKVREELEFMSAGKVLPGFRDLEKEDQEQIRTKLPELKPSNKRKLDTESVGDSKKIKTESSVDKKREEAVEKQTKAMYKIRDKIAAAHSNKVITTKDLHKLLEANKQEVPSGDEKLYDRLADVMTFGALEKCGVCKGGQFVYRSGVGYQCQGYLTEFTKCSFVTEEPKRKVFKVPSDYQVEDIPFLAKYKQKKVEHRVIPKHAATVTASTSSFGSTYKGPKLTPTPLKNFKFFVDLSLKKEADGIKKKIETFGGKIIESITAKSKVAAIISTEAQISAGKEAYLRPAKDNKTPVVSTKFVENIRDVDYNLAEQIQLHLIADWVKPLEIRAHLESVNPDFKKSSKAAEKKSMYEVEMKKVKLKMKDGAVVDPQSGLEDSGHVYKEGNTLYAAILTKVDVEEGSNKYYKLQIIQADKKAKDYWVFRSWGRLGTTIGGHQCDEQGSKEAALSLFHKLYKEKTGNSFGKTFSKKAGCYMPMDIHYSDSKETIKKLEPSTKTSKLELAVQTLISLIFDVDNMQQTLLEFELDLEKMPLGKISQPQILQAYSLLSEATKLLEEGAKKEGYQRLLIDVTNRFFTLIPHNFGTDNPPILQNIEFVRQKIEMLENLMEVELAYELLKEGDEKGGSPIDSHYKTLKCGISTLDKGSQMWQILEKYLKNTHAETHDQYSLELQNIFTVDRKGEEKRFSKYSDLHNRQLLWHGSRISNYAGILSQGLRIAPPEAPVTGYMFGKGVYFADMVSKSANYCSTSRGGNTKGLLLLCEVALGDMAELKDAKDTLLKAPKGKHSVKGLGATQPDPNDTLTLPTGTIVPYGKPTKSKVKDSSLLYNEYIVYDAAQVNILYLLEVDFKYKSRR